MKTEIEIKTQRQSDILPPQAGRSDNPVASAVQTGIQNDFSLQSDVPAPQGVAARSASSSEATGTSLLQFAPPYDADGNMTLIETSTGTWAASSAAHNRPVTWTKSTGEKICMMYDSQGRRVEKRVLNASGVRTLRERYVYVGYACVQVLNGDKNNAVVKEFAWDPTEPVATRPLMFKYVPNGVTMFYAFDGNKNVSDVFCWAVQNGVPAHYDYAPFGAITRTAKNTPFTLDFVSLNPWRFSSEFCDPELDLVYYNYRHYSPSLGRFLSRDPIEEQGGLNLYGACKNNPIAVNDILGKDTACNACPLEECLRNAAEIREQCLADALENYERQDRIIEESYDRLSQSIAAAENACNARCRSQFKDSDFLKNTCDHVCSKLYGSLGGVNYGVYVAAKANNELSLWGNKKQCENDYVWRRAACYLAN